MKLFLHEDQNIEETIIDITYNIFDDQLQKIIHLIEENDIQLEGIKQNQTYIIKSSDIFYIESVDNSTFLYTKTDVFESKKKLYHFEKKLKNMSFVQINKSTILNMDHLRSVSPLPNYRLEADLVNDDRLIISRHYMKYVKEYLNI